MLDQHVFHHPLYFQLCRGPTRCVSNRFVPDTLLFVLRPERYKKQACVLYRLGYEPVEKQKASLPFCFLHAARTGVSQKTKTKRAFCFCKKNRKDRPDLVKFCQDFRHTSATRQTFASIPQYCRAALAIHLVSKMLGPIRSATGSIALLALVSMSSTSAASSSKSWAATACTC